MVQIRNANAILADVRSFLRAFVPETDLSENAVLLDLALRPISTAGELITTELQTAINLQLIDGLSGSDLDNEGAYNFGTLRKTGQKAKGTVTFATTIEPGDDIEIPKGTIVFTFETATTPGKRFATLEKVIIYAATRNNFYNPTTEQWEVSATVEALVEGADGNIAPATIVSIQNRIRGIESVFNTDATFGGSDSETDEQYRGRLKRLINGRELGQREGLEAFVLGLQNFGFEDAKAITVNDLDSERVEGTDVFVIDNSHEEVVETFTFFSGVEDYIFSKQPVREVLEVVSGARGPLFQAGVEYEFIKDTTSARRYSSRAQDKIRVFEDVAGLPNLDTLTVRYVYSVNIPESQRLLDLPVNKIVTADPLVKRAISYLLDIVASVSYFANTDITTEQSVIQSAMLTYLTTYVLGQNVQQSDLIIIMQQGFGDFPVTAVDQVVIRSMIATPEIGESVRPVNEEIEIPDIGYVRFGSITFV